MTDAHDEDSTVAADGSQPQWAPPAPTRHPRRLGLWIGVPGGLVAVGLVAASLVLIAPGTAVAGVQVGGMTAGAAAEAIQEHLSALTVRLHSPDGDVDASVTGAQLGATVDARELADAVYDDHPMWKVGDWFSGAHEATVSLDAETADAALRSAAPDLFTDPTNAQVRFDAESTSYTSVDGVDGVGVDIQALTDDVQQAFATGRTTTTVTVQPTPITPPVTTTAAHKKADQLNAMLKKAGFYVGDERTVPLPAEKVASWLDVADGPDGTITVTADVDAIQKSVDTLAEKVDRKPVNGIDITDPKGKKIGVITPAVDGRTLKDTSGIAAAYAADLEKGQGVYTLPVKVTTPKTTSLSRHIVVDLSDQKTYLYQNGKVLHTYLSSTGTPGHDTKPGSYRIFAKVPLQDMGCYPGAEYCTKDVPWVSYFYPDVGFHGTYWHHNFGHVMSHGCVNLPIDRAKFIYDWAPVGTPVTVRN